MPSNDLAAATIDRSGEILARTGHFDEVIGERAIDLHYLSAAIRMNQIQCVNNANAVEEKSGVSLIAYVPLEMARCWDIPFELKDVGSADGSVVVLGMVPPARRQALREACRAYRLSGTQARIVTALLETGSLRAAAANAGVTYAFARECHRGALRTLGTDSTPALVTQLLAPSFGTLPTSDQGAPLLESAFGLTKRQASLATSIADGFSRNESAKILAVSSAVAKKDLEVVFQSLAVSSATALARIVADARTLGLYFSLTRDEEGYQMAPLAYLIHPSGRKIAYSDYGPVTAKPVLVLHSSMTNRPVFSALVDALHRAGFRPISMDRPGFGLTDAVPETKPGKQDPFALAAEDAIWFCEAMKFGRIDLVARGAAQVAYAIESRKPNLLDRVILINPDPDVRHSGKVKGPFERMKMIFRKNPNFISLYAHIYTRLITPARGMFAMQRSIKGCSPDEEVMRDKRNLNDYVNAEQMFLSGNIEGFINEQTAMALGQPPTPIKGTFRWTIMVGEHDFIHDPLCALDYWKKALPDADALLIPNAGRFLAISHADEIGRLLREHPLD